MIREGRALRKNGEEFDCEIAMSEVGVSPGSPRLFNIVIRDITERRHAEQMEAEAQASKARVQQLERELCSLERLSTPLKAATTAETFGLKPFRQASPDRFNQLVQQYGDLIELALEQKAYKVEYDISGKLRTIAEQLRFFKAGARDVVEIHSLALRSRIDTASHIKAQTYIEEGRVMVLELMGYMVSCYRTYRMSAPTMKTNDKLVKEENDE